jgi:hypothetical protein
MRAVQFSLNLTKHHNMKNYGWEQSSTILDLDIDGHET